MMGWEDDYARLRPQIIDGLGNEGFSIDWLDGRLANGRAQLWISDRAALVTELNAWVVVAAGDKREIVETLRPQAEAWCASRGMSAAIVDGRRGWNRALAPHGYYPFNAGVRKDL